MCRLVMGNKSSALSEISQACQLCRQQPKLLQSHRAQLHVLLGLYAMSMNCMEEAEAQLLSALNVSNIIDYKVLSHIIQYCILIYHHACFRNRKKRSWSRLQI